MVHHRWVNQLVLRSPCMDLAPRLLVSVERLNNIVRRSPDEVPSIDYRLLRLQSDFFRGLVGSEQ